MQRHWRYLFKTGKSYMTFPSWHAVVVCHRTRTRPLTGPNKTDFVWKMDSFPIKIISTEMIILPFPSSQLMAVVAVYRSPYAQAMLIEPSVNSPYIYMTPKIQFISKTSYCRKTSSPGTTVSQYVAMLGVPDRWCSSTIFVACKRCKGRSIT